MRVSSETGNHHLTTGGSVCQIFQLLFNQTEAKFHDMKSFTTCCKKLNLGMIWSTNLSAKPVRGVAKREKARKGIVQRIYTSETCTAGIGHENVHKMRLVD